MDKRISFVCFFIRYYLIVLYFGSFSGLEIFFVDNIVFICVIRKKKNVMKIHSMKSFMFSHFIMFYDSTIDENVFNGKFLANTLKWKLKFNKYYN